MPVVLRGANRSGTEYQCVNNRGIFDGPGTEDSVAAMASWGINAVRVPLNEACWLALDDLSDRLSGQSYQLAIRDYVGLLHDYGLVPILELHWAAPAGELADRQQPMPNVDHSLDFWADVARFFIDDDGVVLEPYNEPYPDFNQNSELAWQCWRDGCIENLDYGERTYQAAGMQAVLDAIREAGSEHIILLGGVQYSNSLSQWLSYMPEDPLGNLAAAWHVYNFNGCRDETCWNDAPADVAAAVPLVATEIGQDDCKGDFIEGLMSWLDERSSGYLAWSWNAYGPCVPAQRGMPGQPREEGMPWSLVASYDCPVPNGDYASAFHAHLNLDAP